MVADFKPVCGFFEVLGSQELDVYEVVLLSQHGTDALEARDQHRYELLCCEFVEAVHLPAKSQH